MYQLFSYVQNCLLNIIFFGSVITNDKLILHTKAFYLTNYYIGKKLRTTSHGNTTVVKQNNNITLQTFISLS